MDLFDNLREANLRKAQPLAARMRPRTLDEFVGQEHFLGPGKLLRRLLQADRLGSVIFYGPPGTGKTALAHVIANHTRCAFRQLNAVAAGIKDVRDLLKEARDELEAGGRRTILFVDELHRFNRAQQDVLLPTSRRARHPHRRHDAEPVLRHQLAAAEPQPDLHLEPLTREQIKALLRRALADKERGLGAVEVRVTEEALDFLAEVSDGDARRALGALEVGVLSAEKQPVEYTLEVARDSIQRKALRLRRDRRRPLRRRQRVHQELCAAATPTRRSTGWRRMLEAGEDPASSHGGSSFARRRTWATPTRGRCWWPRRRCSRRRFVGLPECQLPLARR